MSGIPPTRNEEFWRKDRRDILRRIAALEKARRLENATIGAGGLTIEDGGDVTINDAGRLIINGGDFFALWPSGVPAAQFGPVSFLLGGDAQGLALVDPDGGVYLAATHDATSGESDFQVGLSAPIDNIFLFSDTSAVMTGPDFSRVQCDSEGVELRGSVDFFGTGGQIGTQGVKISPHGTTASGANMHIDATTGLISRSTSSRRYKQDITPADVDVAKVLALEPRAFRAKAEVESDGDDAPTRVGFIAEEAADLGLDEWVTSDVDGPEAFSYATWCVALQAVVRSQQEQIDALTARLDALEHDQAD